MEIKVKVTREDALYVASVEGVGVTQAQSPDQVAMMIRDLCQAMEIGPVDSLDIDWTEVYSEACCVDMASHLFQHCNDHPDPFQCSDQLVVKLHRDMYGLVIHDGGHSIMMIDYCPWCGTRLPEPD